MFRDVTIRDLERRWKHGDAFDEADLVAVSWKEIAERYGAAYNGNINADALTAVMGGAWPRYLLAGEEGELEPSQLLALRDTLSAQTDSSTWYFQYHICATPEITSEALYAGDATDLLTANQQSRCSAGPQYWWPEDRAWCVCTDYDLSFTVVGSNAAAASKLLANPALEALEIGLANRIDHEAYLEAP